MAYKPFRKRHRQKWDHERFERAMTAFDRISVAEPTTVFDLKARRTVLRNNETTQNGASFSEVDGTIQLSLDAQANSHAELSSEQRGIYVAGQWAVSGMGLRVKSDPVDDQVVRWGYFDDTDGFGVGADASGLFTFVRRNGSDSVRRSGDWIDPLDGSGPSGITIDVKDLNIWHLPFRWYGSGPLMWDVSSTAKAIIHPGFTTFDARGDDQSSGAILHAVNLPLRVEADNGASGGALDVQVSGRQFSILGPYDPQFRLTPETRLTQSVGTTLTPLISLQKKSAFGGIPVRMARLEIGSDTDLEWFLLWNASLESSDSFSGIGLVPSDETALESNVSATGLNDNGQAIAGGIIIGGQGSKEASEGVDLPLLDIPTNQPVCLAARSASGTATVSSSLVAREEW